MPAFATKTDKIEIEKLKAFMRMKPTLEDTAAWFQVAPRTIERFIRDNFDLTFVEFRAQNMVHTRHALIRTALRKAIEKEDNTMLIFCLKNMCGWADKFEHVSDIKAKVSNKNPLAEIINDESLLEAARTIAQKMVDDEAE
jgi:hypothetical protein